MSVFAAIFLLFLCSPSLAESESPSASRRNGRLFFVSSSSTTTTVSTSTLCYVTTANNLATCAGVAGRKRRAIAFRDPNNEEEVGELNPAPMEENIASSYDVEEEYLESSKNNPSPFRDPKFLLYWMTTTSTSTATSFTSTFTLSELNCTPTGFTLNVCG